VTGLLTVLSVLVAWALLGVVAVGLLLMMKSVQSTRHWFEKITMGMRAVAHQTRDLPERGSRLAVSMTEALGALGAAAQDLPDPEREES
jgi:hypothetical protein